MQEHGNIFSMLAAECDVPKRASASNSGGIEAAADVDDGTQNLTGALKTSMGTLGAPDLEAMKDVEVIIAPSILTEGKVYQKAQQLGMGK